MKEDSMKKWTRTLHWITFGLLMAGVFVEGGMFFVLRSQNLIYQSVDVYLQKYFLAPVLKNLLIVVIGYLVYHFIDNAKVRQYTQVLMITCTLGNLAVIHSVFLITEILFCVPIFLTVIFRDKKILYTVFAVSELFVCYIAYDGYTTRTGAGHNEYFLPTVMIAMFILFVCNCVASVCIRSLNEQDAALIKANEEAEEARQQAEQARAVAEDARVEAELANQGKTIFLSNMSHEIRTPINAVLGFDEMIIRESEEETIRDYAMDIRSSGKSLLALVNDVLDFSKIESGKLDLVNVEYDVSSVVNDMVNMISNRAVDKGLSFLVKVDPGLPRMLYGDEVRIKQIIMNLLTNAVKYTDTGTVTLSIGYEKNDDTSITYKVSVKDTGKGIKQEDMDKLFTPFERIEEKRNRNIEGTGLGMSITTQLLTLMDSKLNVESVYGEGSEFFFGIVQIVKDWSPVGNYEEAFKRLKSRSATYKEQFIAPNARVLVVDDTPMNLKVFKGLLKKTQIQIDEAHSGMECLNMLENRDYHVVFIDHMMPEMDGIETLKRLQVMEKYEDKNIPVVALTANATSGSRELYLRAGFSEYLTKPIDPMKLEKMLIRFLPRELVELTD